MAGVEQNDVLFVFGQGILLAGFKRELPFGLRRGWDRDDGYPFSVERVNNLPGEGFLEELTGATHGADLPLLSFRSSP